MAVMVGGGRITHPPVVACLADEITQACVGLLDRKICGVEFEFAVVEDRLVCQEFVVSPDSTAVFRWAGTSAADADRRRFVTEAGQHLLHDERVFPVVADVVPVEQPVIRAGEQLIEANPVLQDTLGALVEHELHVVVHGEEVHLVLTGENWCRWLSVHPMACCRRVQLVEHQLGRQQQPPPDRRLRPVQIDPNLIGHRLGPPSVGTRGSGHAGEPSRCCRPSDVRDAEHAPRRPHSAGCGIASARPLLVVAAGGDAGAVGAERHAEHSAGVAGQRVADRLTGGRVPQPHRVVGTAGGDVGAVGAERTLHTMPVWPVSGAPTGCPVAGVPQPHRLVETAGGDAGALGVDTAWLGEKLTPFVTCGRLGGPEGMG